MNRAMAAFRPLLLLPVILAAAALRLWGLDRESLWYDELYSVWVRQLPPAIHPSTTWWLTGGAWLVMAPFGPVPFQPSWA